MMHFPLFWIPLFSEYFRVWEKFSNFSLKMYFSSTKISYDLLRPLTRNFELPPYFLNFPSDSVKCTRFFTYFTCFSFTPSLTMMHLCITQCTYWTPLATWTKAF